MYIPEIPQNSLTEEITQIAELSKKLEDEGYYFEFLQPEDEEKIISWEKENSIIIPESVKDWLRFTRGAIIADDIARIGGINGFESGCDYVPDEMVIIGQIIGDGQLIGFSKETGKIMWETHADIIKFNSFASFLNEVVIRKIKKKKKGIKIVLDKSICLKLSHIYSNIISKSRYISSLQSKPPYIGISRLCYHDLIDDI